MKFTYTKSMIEDIVREIRRRHLKAIADEDYEDDYTAAACLHEKLQGMYGAVMVTAENWPDCTDWFRELEWMLPF